VADRAVDHLLIGGGPAAAACAEALRAGGASGSILMVGREPDPPYDRTLCSKDYLRGQKSREQAQLHPPGSWESQGVELLTRVSAMKLDPAARVVRLSTKEEVSFGSCLLATGANARRLPVEGVQLEGVHCLRALGNADSIRADAEAADSVVLVGGSFIACEVAASLTELGKRCTLVMLEEEPMSTGFGTAVGAYVAGVLRAHGVELVRGDSVDRLEGEERVARVVTAAGRTLPAEAVVMGTGVNPDVMLARAAGLELADSGGVACDATLRTSADGIWAAGDICDYDSVVHGRRLRVEHFEVATAQGRAAAAAMLGSAEPYREVPYFWTDLSDWAGLEYVGPAERWDREIVRGSFDDGDFTVFFLDGDQLAAALTSGRSAELEHAKRFLTDHTDLSAHTDALTDPDTDLSAVN